MNVKKFREVLDRRIYVEEISCGEWADGIEDCWKQEIELLSENIPSTIKFLKNNCTEEEYLWISEVIDDVIEINPNRELVECYENLMKKFPDVCKKHDIAGAVKRAEEILKWEDNFGEK